MQFGHHCTISFNPVINLPALTGRVAQLVERQSNKLPVEGSSPFVTIFIINEHNDHSHTHFLQNIVMKYSDVCHIKNGAKRELNPRPLLP